MPPKEHSRCAAPKADSGPATAASRGAPVGATGAAALASAAARSAAITTTASCTEAANATGSPNKRSKQPLLAEREHRRRSARPRQEVGARRKMTANTCRQNHGRRQRHRPQQHAQQAPRPQAAQPPMQPAQRAVRRQKTIFLKSPPDPLAERPQNRPRLRELMRADCPPKPTANGLAGRDPKTQKLQKTSPTRALHAPKPRRRPQPPA